MDQFRWGSLISSLSLVTIVFVIGYNISTPFEWSTLFAIFTFSGIIWSLQILIKKRFFQRYSLFTQLLFSLLGSALLFVGTWHLLAYSAIFIYSVLVKLNS